MAKSTFGSSFAQTFQQSLAAARKAEDEEKADKRFNERLAEQRAYGVMEDTKKEARALGATAEELGTYSGAENQYALDRRMDELRAEYKAGRTAQLSGEGSGQPTDSLLGETGIATSAGYMRGVEAAKSQQQEQEFLNIMQRKARAGEREAVREEDLQGVRDVASVNPQAGIDFSAANTRQEALQAVAQNQAARNFAAEQMRFGVPTILNFEAGENVASPQMVAELDAAKERYAADKSNEDILMGVKIRSGLELEQQYKQARDRANEDPGSIPPEIKLGYPEGDAPLVRHFAAQDRADADPFFREAINLVPFHVRQSESKKGTPLTDDDGRITKYGRAFLRENVMDKPETIVDKVTGEMRSRNILTFMPRVVEPVTPTETLPDTTFNFDQGWNVQGSPFGSVPVNKDSPSKVTRGQAEMELQGLTPEQAKIASSLFPDVMQVGGGIKEASLEKLMSEIYKEKQHLGAVKYGLDRGGRSTGRSGGTGISANQRDEVNAYRLQEISKELQAEKRIKELQDMIDAFKNAAIKHQK